MGGRRNFLDADNNIMEKNLRFVKNDLEENINNFFTETKGNKGGNNADALNVPPREYKVVQPNPGLCIKTFKVNTNEKYFINVCQTTDIPPPEDISESELHAILNSEEPSAFRIPMSISEPRITRDKSENPVDAVDIAVNSKFFTKIEKSILFRDFFLVLIAEALNDKYNVQVKVDKAIILAKRKFIGSLVSHRVRNYSTADLKKFKNAQDKICSKQSLVQEINTKELSELKQMTERLKKQQPVCTKTGGITQSSNIFPDYKLRARIENEQVDEIQAEFYLPKCISSQEFSLDIGEDRILLESMKHGYLFDKFVNYRLNQERARAIFDKTNKMLQVRIPVLTA